MTDILNLPPWKVISVEETDQSFLITAEIEGEPKACPRCGVLDPKLQRFGTHTQEVPDLPIRFKRTVILAVTQRFRCLECGKTFYRDLPQVEETRQATCRLVDYVKFKSLEKPFTDVAAEVQLDEKTVRNIFDDYLTYLEETVTFRTPEWLGMDELFLRKRTPPYGVLTNIKERTVYDLLKNRTKETVAKRISKIKDKDRIQLVCMDMHDAYRIVVNDLLPKRPVIVDKFHLVRMANTSLERFRIAMKEELPAAQRRQLKSDRFAMLRRGKNITDQDRMTQEIWFAAYPEMRTMYDLKEKFFEIFELEKRAEAEKEYEAWQKSIPSPLRVWFKDLDKAFVGWREEIFNYFDFHVTNAYTESSNAKTRSTSDEGKGYSFKSIRAKTLYNLSNLKVKSMQQIIEVRVTPSHVLLFAVTPFEADGVDIDKLQPSLLGVKEQKEEEASTDSPFKIIDEVEWWNLP